MNFEAFMINLVSKLAPWLATFPTAWTIGTAVHNRLLWPSWAAGLVGVAVETLGVASSATALELWSYQREKRKVDPDAPVALGVVMVGLYFVGVLLLTVVLESNLLLAVFPVLSLVGVGNLALRADQAARTAQVAQDKTQAAAQRSQKRSQPAVAAAQVTVVRRSPAELLAEFSGSAAQANYVCGTCGAAYEKQVSLAAHMRRHKRIEVFSEVLNGEK